MINNKYSVGSVTNDAFLPMSSLSMSRILEHLDIDTDQYLAEHRFRTHYDELFPVVAFGYNNNNLDVLTGIVNLSSTLDDERHTKYRLRGNAPCQSVMIVPHYGRDDDTTIIRIFDQNVLASNNNIRDIPLDTLTKINENMNYTSFCTQESADPLRRVSFSDLKADLLAQPPREVFTWPTTEHRIPSGYVDAGYRPRPADTDHESDDDAYAPRTLTLTAITAALANIELDFEDDADVAAFRTMVTATLQILDTPGIAEEIAPQPDNQTELAALRARIAELETANAELRIRNHQLTRPEPQGIVLPDYQIPLRLLAIMHHYYATRSTNEQTWQFKQYMKQWTTQWIGFDEQSNWKSRASNALLEDLNHMSSNQRFNSLQEICKALIHNHSIYNIVDFNRDRDHTCAISDCCPLNLEGSNTPLITTVRSKITSIYNMFDELPEQAQVRTFINGLNLLNFTV